MASLTVYRLTFCSGFHLGVRGVNLEETSVHIPSDTLFSALVDAAIRTGTDGDAFVAPFREGAPPFLLTSAFPFAGAVRFFPMPVSLPRWFGQETLRDRSKELRRIRFLSEGLFRRMLAGEPMDEWLFPDEGERRPGQGVALQDGKLWLTSEEVEKLPAYMREHPRTGRPLPLRALRYQRVFATSQVPRVTVDRVSAASEIFHTGRASFSPECGLWFGIEWRTPQAKVGPQSHSVRDIVHLALAILADDGLGGERTTGYGGFSWEEETSPLVLDSPTQGGLLWLLSRYHPREDELPGALAGQGTGYQLIPVGGWLRSWEGPAQRRKRLWMVAEGSIIRTVGSGPWGDVSDVRPTYNNPEGDLPHPVWRAGLALGAGIREV